MAKALIVYASLTGNTEEMAGILEEYLEELGVDTRVQECTEALPSDFLDADICVVATYTYGRDAELPDEIYDFYEELPDVDLSGKVYGVLGSGDTLYDKFCQSVDDFDKQLERTNARRGASPVKVNDYADEEDKARIRTFAEDLVSACRQQKGDTPA